MRSVLALSIVHRKSPYKVVTLSAGLAFIEAPTTAAAVVSAADARLYEAKSSGVKMMERELGVLSKEITTSSALKLALERRSTAKDGVS